jgi:predicted lysophospholipase L1 biosynthesis ABC-type transport system permease subunit
MASVLDEVPKRAIEQQIVLPWSRALQMTRENIFVRLGRSAITASGIFLGIAFLSAVLFGAAAGAVAAGMQKDEFGIDASTAETQARVIWLAAMSLLVATVGIVNSMLMSVTERYKEIGTMKCLGALDSFIVRLFLLEAGLLGMLGSAAGAIAGTGLMTVVYANRTVVSAGKMGWSGALSSWRETCLQLGSWGVPLWLGIIFAVVIGAILSLLASLYPAWRAAKMPPAAALRSEF